MKSASASMQKFIDRSSGASGDYSKGAESTSKDQAALAAASAAIWGQAITAAIGKGSFAKGLNKAGKGAWLNGVKTKGVNRYAEGVAASGQKYATNSAPFDAARGAAASLPRGLKGSEQNINRVKAVVTALRATKG